MDNDKPRQSILSRIGQRISEQNKGEEKEQPSELSPAMPELGTAPCPVCGHHVAVFVTRTKRPFINCGFCSVRIFYNGSRSMQLLKAEIQATENSEKSSGAKFLNSLKELGKEKL